MTRPISSLMKTHVHSAGLDDTVQQVEARMVELGLSWLPVCEAGGGVVGVIRAIDLLGFHVSGRNDAEVRAWELCHYKPLSVSPDTPVAQVARLMLEQHLHHVIVAGSAGLQGVVSTTDFLQAFVEGQ